MPVAATVPVAVSPEAEARLAELGLRPQVERMVAYARENLPEVTHIDVVLNDRYDLGGEPGVAVDVYSKRPFKEEEDWQGEANRWVARQFPPEQMEHLLLCYFTGVEHAG